MTAPGRWERNLHLNKFCPGDSILPLAIGAIYNVKRAGRDRARVAS